MGLLLRASFSLFASMIFLQATSRNKMEHSVPTFLSYQIDSEIVLTTFNLCEHIPHLFDRGAY